MTTLAIIGAQWGDEGKGKIVDWLAAKAHHVARFQGGHNAGHTIVVGGEKTTLHLLPSGVLHTKAKCYIGNGVVLSLSALGEEIDILQARGADLRGRLFVSTMAALVLPYHIALDRARESGKANIGTTLRGIGPAHEDKAGRRAVRLCDCFRAGGEDLLRDNANYYNHLLSYYGAEKMDGRGIWREVKQMAEKLRPFISADIPKQLAAASTRGEAILLEGAQGAMLDIELGTYPFATSAHCSAAYAAIGLGVQLSPRVVAVIKGYATRVGGGPFPTEIAGAEGEMLAKVGMEFGSTTGRARRCGWLDIPMLRGALRANGCRDLIVTKLDVFDALAEIKICTAYQTKNGTTEEAPPDSRMLEECKPVYETLPGWQGQTAANAASETDLPPNARRLLSRIESLSGAKITAISTGPDRRAIIPISKLF